jgi:uncharacterized protein
MRAIRIAVLADTHLSLDLARQALRQAGPVDEVFHLGDFYADALALAKEIKTPLAAVRGNTDFEEGPNDLVLERLGHRLFLTHGHYYDVPETLDRLAAEAARQNCTVALFGHSHLPLIERRSGLLLVNPGSLFFPETNKTFAILELAPDRVEAQIISLNGHTRRLK